MLCAYLNYPNKKVSIHGDRACGQIKQAHNPGQRSISLRHGTLDAELARFVGGGHQFASHSGANDMWLEVEFADPDFEEAIVRHIHRLLAVRYKPFQNCAAERHC